MHILHFFVPHKKNNHRAKLLHNVTLTVLILTVAITSSLAVYLQKTHPEVLGISYQISDMELLNLTNYERTQNGLPPLALNRQLSTAAHNKSDHMFANNYWAHFAPDGTSPWYFIKNAGYEYTYAGENLAKGFTTSSDAMSAWMKSPTHRANILARQYEDVGFSVAEGKLQGEDTILIVQEFGARDKTGTINPNGTIDTQLPPNFGNLAEVKGSTGTQNIENKPLLDIGVVAKTITFILLSALLIALVLDFIIIEKKKIPRVVGNNLDHIILITIFVSFLLMAKLGKII
jgi:uncharacterized protein YkwD